MHSPHIRRQPCKHVSRFLPYLFLMHLLIIKKEECYNNNKDKEKSLPFGFCLGITILPKIVFIVHSGRKRFSKKKPGFKYIWDALHLASPSGGPGV